MFTFLTNTQFKIHEKANTRNSPHYFYDCKKLWYNNTVILSDHSIQKMTNDKTYREWDDSHMLHETELVNKRDQHRRLKHILSYTNTSWHIYTYFSEVLGN